MPTAGALESRPFRVPVLRLAGLSVTRSAGSDGGTDRCGAEFLWRAARYNAACCGARTERTLPETGACRARDVRCAVHGAAFGRPDMEEFEAREEAERRIGLYSLHRRDLRYPVRRLRRRKAPSTRGAADQARHLDQNPNHQV